MPTDLAQHIHDVVAIDTHEHLRTEDQWLNEGPPDVLADLFNNYVTGDLVSAGAATEAVKRAVFDRDGDLDARWAGIAKAWEAVRFTGYGEAVRIMARDLYDIDEIEPAAMHAAQPVFERLRRPGERLRLLREKARLDHVQIDNFTAVCAPDASGPEFFLYDLAWAKFCMGSIDFTALTEQTDITVKDLATLDAAIHTLFERYGPVAIAVKSQHAYHRTLRWQRRDDADAGRALDQMLRAGANIDDPSLDEVKLCLGDWCMARGAKLAGEYGLPFKIHTGYYAGNNHMVTDRIRPGHLCSILPAFPETRFVLMHIGYPYSDELISVVKHFPNAWGDLCWAWSINPYHSVEFVRRYLHAAPANKLFAFGGDTSWPTSAYAYSVQARRGLTRALEAGVAAGEFDEPAAMDLATGLLRENQLACFNIESTRRAIRQAVTA